MTDSLLHHLTHLQAGAPPLPYATRRIPQNDAVAITFTDADGDWRPVGAGDAGTVAFLVAAANATPALFAVVQAAQAMLDACTGAEGWATVAEAAGPLWAALAALERALAEEAAGD